jgi:hypothetical protein
MKISILTKLIYYILVMSHLSIKSVLQRRRCRDQTPRRAHLGLNHRAVKPRNNLRFVRSPVNKVSA